MSTQGISNMLAYGASAAVRRHVWESLERLGCCGGVDWGGRAGVGRGSAILGLRSVAREMETMGSRSSGGGGGGGGGVIRSAASDHSDAMSGGGGGDGDLTSGANRSDVDEDGNKHDSDGKEVLLEVDLSADDLTGR